MSRLRSLFRSRPGGPARLPLALVSLALFAISWILRYNDPEGGYGGLTDDHFYYVIRGWQMLFGEFPDRDYVDAGAPLAYAISAALQLIQRGTWSEFVFCVTALSAGTALTCVAAAQASGSVVLGVLAALLEMALFPRLYNYPKILVYAAAIPLLWHWINAPSPRRSALVAVAAVVAFLLRHDHGAYIAGTFVLFALLTRKIPWRETARQIGVFAITATLCLTPYLTYLQINGGIVRHFDMGYRWSLRDRDRAPLELPRLEWQPLSTESGEAPPEEWWNHAPFPALRAYRTWWLFWMAELLPFAALLLLALRRQDRGPAWPDEPLKIGATAVLAILVNNGFLRGNLAIQLPDIVVPMSILAAWCAATTMRLIRSGQLAMGSRRIALPPSAKLTAALATLAVGVVTAGLLVGDTRERMESSSLFDGVEAIRSDMSGVTERLQHVWPLEPWAADDSRGAMQLALYVHSCTAPTDRVLVTPYLPPVVGLAQRGFAGGQGDLRAGFFATEGDQELTVERLRRQTVPVVIGPPRSERSDFNNWLPIVARYLDGQFEDLGDRELGEGLVISLLVNRTARVVRTYEPLSFPCFR